MTRRRFLFLALSILAAAVTSVPPTRALRAAEALPDRLTDKEFWTLVNDFSEPNGYFRSDNLLSNEVYFQYVVPDLGRTAKAGRAYLGVGPEQNFTYIAAVKPKMAFIIDIRRGNLDLQLMYKALFELSADRAEFVSRLFAIGRPAGLDAKASVTDLFQAYLRGESSESLYLQNVKDIRDQLVNTHNLPLSAEDLDGIEYVYRAFHEFGPRLRYSSTGRGFGFGGNQPTYADLMTATDANNQAHSYLASEESFGVMKGLERRNLIVPVVGNFAGPKAIRAVGWYLREHDAVVSAFYLSNVEQYLRQDGIWDRFCGNVATLPLDDSSTFIRSVRDGRYGQGFGLNSDLGAMAAEVKRCE